jgi:hypothetical protein
MKDRTPENVRAYFNQLMKLYEKQGVPPLKNPHLAALRQEVLRDLNPVVPFGHWSSKANGVWAFPAPRA